MDESGDQEPFGVQLEMDGLGFTTSLVADLKGASGQSCGLGRNSKRGFLVLSSTAST